MRLENKIAIVAGGAQGIGRQAAISMAREGAKVIVADINEAAAAETIELIKNENGTCSFFHLDITDWNQVQGLMEFAQDSYGIPNVLYNSIATYKRAKLAETEIDDWEKIMRVNVTGSFLICKAIIPLMLKIGGGSIILTSSSVGVQGTKANIFPYATSKFAITGMVRAAACDYVNDNIRVNCICPGPTDTPMIRGGRTPEELEKFVSSLPIGRLADPEEIAQAIVFLASDESKFITGVALFVDGGQNAHV